MIPVYKSYIKTFYLSLLKGVITISLLFSCFPSENLRAQTIETEKNAFAELEARGEIYFSFPVSKTYTIDYFIHLFSVDRVRNDTVYAYANKDQFSQFLSTGIPYRLLTPPSMQVRMQHPIKSTGEEWQLYPSYSRYIEMMDSFVIKYPSVCKLVEIGNSIGGKKILAVKISDNVNMQEDEPAVFFSSTIHGDEGSGFILMLRLIDHLLSHYTNEDEIAYLVEQAEIYINPLANPDGLYFVSDTSVIGARRFNLNNIDLNRNFPDPDEGLHPDGYAWQPETEAMMNFMSENRFNLSANFHGGAELVNYPWDTWYRRHADNAWYTDISREYADSAHKYSQNTYMLDENNGITNGYDWYRITGGRQDYVNYYLHSREVTIELSHTKLPIGYTLQQLWNYNKEALIGYVYNCFEGVRGKVMDSETLQPLAAKIFIPDYDKDSSFIYSDKQSGSFFRLLVPGAYTMNVNASGYLPATISATAYSKTSVVEEVYLDKVTKNFKVYPNPFSQKIFLEINEAVSGNIHINVIDMAGRIVYTETNEVSSPEVMEIDLSELKNGVYTVQLQGEGFIKNLKIIRVSP